MTKSPTENFMGEVRDNGLLDSIASPQRVSIEKAQAELRQEYDLREQWRRELKFLEKGGNPLDFKFEATSTISLQSTSVADQPAENRLTSEAKGTPNGDSAESSERPGTCHREVHTADNLMFFEGKDALPGQRNGTRSNKRVKLLSSGQYSQPESVYAKEMENLSVCTTTIKRQHYARRNRSRPSRDAIRATSIDMTKNYIPNGNPTLASNQHLSEEKSPPVALTKDREENAYSGTHLKTANPIVNGLIASTSQSDMEVDTMRNQEAEIVPHGSPKEEKDVAAKKSPQHDLFLDSEEAFVEEGCGALGFVVSIKNSNKEDDSPVPLSGDPTAMQKRELPQISVVCEGSSVPCSGEDPKGNLEKVPPELVLADDQISVLKADVDSNAIKVRSFDLSQIPAVTLDYDRNKEDLKCDPSDLQTNGLPGNETNRMDVDVQVKSEEEVCDSRTWMLNGEETVAAVAVGESKNLLDTSNSKSGNLHCGVRPVDNFVSSSSAPEVAEHMVECSRVGTLPDNEKNTKELEKNKLQVICTQNARAMKVTLKRGLTDRTHPVGRKKTQWDFLLEEMAWLANDFVQERMWKIAAAAQVCCWISQGNTHVGKMRRIARSMAISVMDFWQLAKTRIHDGKTTRNLHEGDDFDELVDQDCSIAMDGSMEGEKATQSQEHINHSDVKHTKRKSQLPLFCYAMRFLKYDQSRGLSVRAEAPSIPLRADAAVLEVDEFSEVNLFYVVPPGVLDIYQRSLESISASNGKCNPGINLDTCDASFSVDQARDHEAEFEYGDFESVSRYPCGTFDARKLKFSHKRRKNLHRSHGIRGYELKTVSGMGLGNCMDGWFENPVGTVAVKRESGNLNVGSIPTKRVRTAARQRIVGPFCTGAPGGMHLVNNNDASSGDTSSLQDELSPLHVGSRPTKTLEVESTCDFVNSAPPEGSDFSTKKKKKKKKGKSTGYRTFLTSTEPVRFAASCKAQSSDYEHRRFTDQVHQHEQSDQLQKRIEGRSLEPNGNSGLHAHHVTKRLKVSKQLPDITAEASSPLVGSLPFPAASQVSNIANPNKLMKLIVNREGGWKTKGLKLSGGQSRDGVPWTLFEDQALVVLVHDLGPNWHLVSDAINSTLQFKSIFRKPMECKDRHKALMDKNTGDGADSAEDSGTSQPYPFTLPGIPKGSARQLFKRLQEPMEDDILKAHFDKIILVGSQQHSHKIKSESQEQLPVTPTHSSHSIALSQTCTTNLSGGLLTPLDLCETMTSSPDALSPSYPVAHSPGLPLSSNQGAVAPMQSNSMGHVLHASGTMVLGNTIPAPHGQTPRDFQRHTTAKSMGLSLDDQHRLQQFNQMVSNRNIQQSGLAANAGLPRMIPGSNGVGIMPGMSRGMPMTRPGYQGIGSPSILNMVSSGTSSMLSSGGIGTPHPPNMYSGFVSGHGNTIPRSREAMQMVRPGQPSDDQRKIQMRELQIQVPQGNGQPMSSFSAINTPFSNQMTSSPVQHPQAHQVPQQPRGLNNPNHCQVQNSNGNTQQSYMCRLGKERSYQPRLLQHQQQNPDLPPNITLPRAQQQHAISPLLANGSSQTQTQPPPRPPQQHSIHINQQQGAARWIPMSSSTPLNQISFQNTQRQHALSHAASVMNASSGMMTTPNEVTRPRQRQQMPQHRQQSQTQQPKQHQQVQKTKVLNGPGRGNVVGLPPEDGSYAGGPPFPGNKVVEKGDQLVQMMHGQRLSPGTMASQAQPRKPQMQCGASGSNSQTNVHLSETSSTQSSHQKLYARPVLPSGQSQLSSSFPEAGSTIPGRGSAPKNLSSLPVSMQVTTVSQLPSTSTSVSVSDNSPPISSSSPNQLPQQLLKPDQTHQERYSTHSQQPIQRRPQNYRFSADLVSQSAEQSASQIPKNPIEPSPNTGHPSCLDSALVAPEVPSPTTSQWAPEQLNETSPPTSTGNVAENKPLGSELPLSGSSPSWQRHSLGAGSVHGHNGGNHPWQQPLAPMLTPQSPPALPQQSRAIAQSTPQQHSTGLGGIYGSLPSSGPP